MSGAEHRIGRIGLEVVVADLDRAMALRPRVEALAWRLIPGTIERVFDAVAPDDADLWIDRLEVNLGRIGSEAFETDALAALELALGAAVREAVAAARAGIGDGPRLVDPAVSVLDQFERYLVSGVAPLASSVAPFDPHVRLESLIGEQPQALIQRLRSLATNRRAIERLALQAGETGLASLLRLLAPADAALILAVVKGMVAASLRPPLSTASGLAKPKLVRLMHVATLEFLLRRPAGQFNGQMFLEALLRREATAARIDYAELLALMSDAVDAVRYRAMLPTPFLTLLDLVISRTPVVDTATRRGTQEADSAEADGLDATLARLRRAAAQPAGLATAISELDARQLDSLIARLDPDGGSALARLRQLDGLHRATPLLSLPAAAFSRLIRETALRMLVEGGGVAPADASWTESLIAEAAEQAMVTAPPVTARLRRALALKSPPSARRRKAPPVPAELTQTSEDAAPSPALPEHAIRALSTAERAKLLARLKPAGAPDLQAELQALWRLHAAEPFGGLGQADFERLTGTTVVLWLTRRPLGRFDPQALWRHMLDVVAGDARVGTPALAAKRPRLARTAAAVLEPAAAASVAAMLDDWAREQEVQAAEQAQRDARRRSVALFLATGRPTDVGRALSETLARDSEWLAATLRRRAETSPEDVAVLAERLMAWLTPFEIVDCLAPEARGGLTRLADGLADGGGPFWRSAIVDLLATDQGSGRGHDIALRRKAPLRLGGEPEAPAARTGAPPSEPAPDTGAVAARDGARRARVERFLLTGKPKAGAEALAWVAGHDRPWLSDLIWRLARQASSDPEGLIDRLLAALAPQAVVAVLVPGDPDQVRALLGQGQDPSTAAWRRRLLRLFELDRAGASGLALLDRLDRLALVGHVLATGALPWWGPDAAEARAILARLADSTMAELASLLVAGDPEATTLRLWRAIDRLGAADGERLLDRIAPWAARAFGPLASALATAGPSRRLEIKVQAAAATLSNEPIDMRRIATPPARPPSAPSTSPSPKPPPAPRHGTDVGGVLEWLGGARDNADAASLLIRGFIRGLDQGDSRLVEYLRTHATDAEARRRWTRLLPEDALGRIVFLLAPGDARACLDALMLIGTAWRQAAPFGFPRPDAGVLWETVLSVIARPRSATVDTVVQRLVRTLTRGDLGHGAKLMARAERLAKDGGYVAVAAVLRRRLPAGPDRAEPRPVKPDAVQEEPAQDAPDTAIFIANAGLVLASPYLPTLFERLGLLTLGEDGVSRIRGFEAASRAVHLLQFLVDGRTDAPEPALALNKLLCGLALSWPVARSFERAPDELEMCEGLLRAMIANWPIIKNTSVSGLRETFLQREGRLLRGADKWTLQVQRKSLDVLTDQVPWSFTTVYHRWMAEPLHVTW